MTKRRLTLLPLVLTFIVCLAASRPLEAQEDEASAAALAVVQRFFDSMRDRDSIAATATLLETGQFISTRAGADGGPTLRAQPFRDYVATVARLPDDYLERMWNPTVLLRGDVAMVWAPYDFHVNGRFSHCGIDVFSLLRTADGWKIAAGAYTVEREGCAPSPLGPPSH